MDVPEFVFDPTLASVRYPRPEVKTAFRVPIPHEYPTFIQPEWDENGASPQTFYGDYYLIVDPKTGRGRYGSAAAQWLNMHRPLDPAVPLEWVKVRPPVGYHLPEQRKLVTLIPDKKDGEIRESVKVIDAGTLVLRQPGGEHQFVRPQDEPKTYFTLQEAQDFGLTDMTEQEFGAWALAHAGRFLNV